MERKKLDEIIGILGNIGDIREINRGCQLLGITERISEEEMQKIEDLGLYSPEFEKIADKYERMIKEMISSTEEKIKLEDEDYFYDKLNEELICFIGNDKKKEKLLAKIEGKRDKAEIIKSIQDDDKKISLMKEVLEDVESWERSDIIENIIKSIQDDDKKIGLLGELSYDISEESKVEVIKSIQDDDKKIGLLGELSDDISKAKVIMSLSENRIEQCSSDNEFIKQCKLIYDLKKGENIPIDEGEHKYDSFGLPSEMTIGAEIEAEGIISRLVLDNIGKISSYQLKADGSLQNGIEAVSPIMYGASSEDVNEIYKVTGIMKALGFSTSERCGGHVHIGADYLKSVEEMKELLEIWGNAEEIFYLISNNPGELPRKGTQNYAKTISGKIERKLFR